MGLLDLIKREQKNAKIMVEAKEAERFYAFKEQEKQNKIEMYEKEGILYCPKCTATNLRPMKKKYKILNNGNGGKLTDFQGNVICELSQRTIDVECLCCGNRWSNK